MLVREVASEFGDRVKVAIEEYGNSALATRFGVRRYPVVFVDDVLLARPKDFGFKGEDDTSGGLYVPWLDPANQRRFRNDLRGAVSRRLSGDPVRGFDIAEVRMSADAADGPERLPAGPLIDIHDDAIPKDALAGKQVVVDMWATWCPPCRSTLEWLDTLQRSRSDIAVIAIAVDSKLEEVQQLAGKLRPSYRVVFGTPEVVQAFGVAAAVPKLMIFNGEGVRIRTMYGAPPDLHAQIEAAVGKSAR